MSDLWLIGHFIAGWMLVTGHYPLNLDIALNGFRTKQCAFEPDGNLARLSGCLFIAGYAISYWLSKQESLAIVFYVLGSIALGVSIVSSFKTDFRK